MDKTKVYVFIIVILLLLIGILSIFFYVKLRHVEKVELSPISTPLEVQGEKKIRRDIILYFATEDGEHLGKEVRTIETAPKELPKRIFQELKKGPREKGLYKVLDDNVRLRDIYISGKVGFVDLSDDILKKGMGSTEELLVIYSITNSLCFSLNLSEIRFLVDGKEIDTFGHIDISGPIYPNYDIIAR